jgi:pimeloyl-ACP methyl ester carboxylesterase
MLVDLVRVTTADGVRLDGALQLPAEPIGDADRSVDAALVIHGTGGSFYSSTLLEALAARLLELGIAVLAVNTRGHDLVSTAATADGPRRQGAAYEDVGRCRQDIAAWLDWLAERKLNRVALVGHSSGAIKAVYSQASKPHVAVSRIVALSPPRLSYSHFAASEKATEFLLLLAEAEALVAAGRGEQLMDVRFPLPYLVTAAGFIDKYGRDERYNVLKLLPAVVAPTLVTLGGQEVATNVAFRGMPEAVAATMPSNQRLSVELIPDADHFYSGRRAELIATLERWLSL